MKHSRLKLGVNIDHVATLRQARGTAYPDLLEAAAACERAGAEGITVHLREDRRHVQDADVYALRKALKVRMNLEMAVVPEIVAVALEVKPDEVCLVPERRQERTTEGGLDPLADPASLAEAVARLKAAGIAVSLFVEADAAPISAAAEMKADCVELHTGTFCDAASRDEAGRQLRRLAAAARSAHGRGLIVNAGHGINLSNLDGILRLPHLHTLNIGHSIVARAVFTGLEQAVREMRARMDAYAGGEA